MSPPNPVRKPYTAANIEDATAAGRDMLTAANVGAQRTLLELGSAALSDAADFATAAQGSLADSAVQPADLGTAAAEDVGAFAAAVHTHSIADVTNLQTALDGKQAAGSYAAASHSHAISDVTGLQSALDGKAATSHTHSTSDITSGTFADARIAESNVTQHEEAITLVESPPIFLSPQDADAAGGTNVVDFVIPFAFNLTSVEFRCRESDPPTGSAAQLDVLLAGTTIFSTNPTIDANEFSSTTAAIPPVLTSNPTALTSGQRLQFDLDQVGAANEGRGYYAILRGTRTNA